MDCLCSFTLDKPRIGDIDSHDKNQNQQESNIKSLRGQPVWGNACKGLHILSDRIRRCRYEVQRIGFLYQIARGIGKIQADCPDKIRDGVQPVHDLFPDTVQPVPRQPIPARVHIKIKLVVVQWVLAVFVGGIDGIIHQPCGMGDRSQCC